jgi:vancomycin permeability regulator SanA
MARGAREKTPDMTSRLRRLVVRALVTGVLVVVAANAWVFHATSADILASAADAPARPVAIVLGNRVFSDGTLSRELAARVRASLDLYRAGKVKTIFLSGAARADDGYDEPEMMAGWLERRGVPRSALVLDGHGHRTAATMANAAARGFHDVLVCTQRYHLPRSLYLARHAGLSALGVSAEAVPGPILDTIHSFFRESLARAETVAEVALRGVRAW